MIIVLDEHTSPPVRAEGYFLTSVTMAKKLSDSARYITLSERDYLTLLEDHIMLQALKIAGIEKEAVFRAAESIMKNNHIEVHIRPIDNRYK